jgi:hypothetical protein
MWTVQLTSPISPVYYREGFFPVSYYTKANATWLANEVKSQGGTAEVVRTMAAK